MMPWYMPIVCGLCGGFLGGVMAKNPHRQGWLNSFTIAMILTIIFEEAFKR